MIMADCMISLWSKEWLRRKKIKYKQKRDFKQNYFPFFWFYTLNCLVYELCSTKKTALLWYLQAKTFWTYRREISNILPLLSNMNRPDVQGLLGTALNNSVPHELMMRKSLLQLQTAAETGGLMQQRGMLEILSAHMLHMLKVASVSRAVLNW